MIGIAGAGTIGSALIRKLSESADVAVKAVLVRDASKRREGLPSGTRLTTSMDEILSDPSVGTVVELMGGTEAAFVFASKALKAGKNLVTANKNLIAERGPELFALACERGLAIGFEAAVCAGIPVIRAFQESLRADRITAVEGILNGTTNYILTRMDEDGSGYAEALAAAQSLGLAEPDPSYDVSGRDSACKLAILATLATGARVDPRSLHVEGIERLDAEDVRQARRMGYRIKLLGYARAAREGGLEDAGVGPMLVPEGHPLAAVRLENNAVLAECEGLGPNLFMGKGAGPMPTATALFTDILDIAQGRGRVPAAGDPFLSGAASCEAHTPSASRRYLRFSVPDRPGVLAAVSGLFAAQGISIKSVLQPETREDGMVPLVITTHAAPGSAFASLAKSLEAGGWGSPVAMRIVED